MQNRIGFLTFQITQTRKYRYLLFKTRFLGTPADLPDPPDPAETRHEAWCTTPGTLAPEVRMTVVLNKLLQIMGMTYIFNMFTFSLSLSLPLSLSLYIYNIDI